MVNNFFILGHRGARGEWLENSQIGFANTQKLAVNGVEFDVQLTADNQLIVLHDEHLQRLARRQNLISQMTINEIKRILVSDYSRFFHQKNPNFFAQPILLLTDLLPYLQGYQHIELEVKTHIRTPYQTLIKALDKILQQTGWKALPITVTSFDTRLLANLSNRYKKGLLLQPICSLPTEIAFLPTSKYFINDTFNLACQLGCQQVGIYYPLINQQIIDYANKFDLSVTAWTVNNHKISLDLLNLGIKTIITDYPTNLLQHVANRHSSYFL